MYYQLADIISSVHPERNVAIDHYGSDYHSFICKIRSSVRNVDVNIFLHNGIPAEDDTYNNLFETKGGWSVWCNDAKDMMLVGNTFGHEPLWMVKTQSQFKTVNLYYNNLWLKREKDILIAPSPLSYPIGQILFMYILGLNQGGLFHAMGINVKGKGLIFPGKSGAGKSTLSRQFSVRQSGIQLSDDRVAVRKVENIFKVYGTPWPGEAGIAINEGAVLSALLFITHSEKNRIIEIGRQEALERLMPVISIPWYDKDIVPKMLDFCENLIMSVPCYELQFKPDAEVVDVVEQFAAG